MSSPVASEKDVTLAVALASGASTAAAAEQAGICQRTVQRRLEMPDFRKLVADFRGELVTQALGRMADNMTRAADTLAAMLDSANDGLRIRAARALITLGVRLRDSVELTERIRNLESGIAQQQSLAS